MTADYGTLLGHLTDAERTELEQLLAADVAEVVWRPFVGPQTMAYESQADITGYGGAAGGGKTDLAAGLILTKHKRILFARAEKSQTEGLTQRLEEIVGSTDGLNSQKGIWHMPTGQILELAGFKDLGSEKVWQGRPHDLKLYDEATEMREQQVRFTMGWNRTSDASIRPRVVLTFNPPTTAEGRWVIPFFAPWLDRTHPLYPTPVGTLRWCAMLPDEHGRLRDSWFDSDGQALDGRPFVMVDGRSVFDFDPADYAGDKAVEVITPKSRTFIAAKVTDNPVYMATGYISTLQAMEEPLRSAMLYGNFLASMEDDPFQVCPTAWVEAAMARWKPRLPRGEMVGMGVDVARGGKDLTTIATRHVGMWFDEAKVWPGKTTPDGPTVAGHVLSAVRDGSPIHIDVIGVGSSPYDFLRTNAHLTVYGVNVAEKATKRDRSGRIGFLNLRTQLWWEMREALDPANETGIALPPDKQLLQELCAPKWEMSGMTYKVESREEIVKRVGRSPDRATAYLLALIDMPKVSHIEALGGRALNEQVLAYDPLANIR